jgi:spermidine synthase
MLLIGSLQPIDLNVQRIAARFNRAGPSNALAEVGVPTPAALLATWVTDRVGLEHYVAGAPPVTDDRPRLEYANWLRHGEFARVLPRVLDLRTDPPLVGADQGFRAEVDDARATLLNFYAAALYAYKGDREHWAQSLEQVLGTEPDNPYYLWIVGKKLNRPKI